MSKKILNLTEQKHIWSTLSETFIGLTQQEKYDIIKALGLDGLIGEDGSYIPFYSMDIHSSRPTYITNQFDTKLTANLYNYTENVSSDVIEWKWERISGNPTEDENWAVGKNTRELNLTYADFTDRFTEEQNITFKVSATIKGKTVTDEIVFSKILYFSKVQIVSDKNVFIENTPNTIRLSFTTDIAVNSVKWYIDNRFLSVSETFELGYNLIPLGGSATIKLEVKEKVTGKVFTDSLTIPRLSVGKDGEPGVKGPPGTSSYTWIKYADGPNGEGINEYPFKLDGTAREYIGMAVGKDSSKESNNPADYVWTKYIGDQGIPGENGYMWIKYSLYSNGRDPSGDVEMFDTPFITKPNGEREDMVYMGIAYNKQTQQEADPNTPEGVPEQYVWAKIRGEDGRTPYTLDLSNDNVSVPANSSGTTGSTAFDLAKTDIKLYYGNDVIDPSEYTLSFIPTNVTYALSNNNHHLQITSMTGNTGEVRIEAKANNKLLATTTFSIVKVVGTATYEILPSTSVIKIVNNYTGGDQKVQPTSIEVKIKKNTGESVDTVYEGKLTYRYIYASSVGTDDDGVNIPIDKILEIDNSGDPLFLEFKYFHPVTNAMVDRETIPFVRDGVSANTTELRYAKNGSFTVAPTVIDGSDPNPAGWTINPPDVGISEVLWMIKAIKKVDGSILGTWSNPVRLTGPAGPQGPQGPAGQGGDLFIAPMGLWDPAVQYKGSTTRVEAVKYQNSWYVTRTDAGSIPIGTAPTNTTYWNQAQENFDFIATGLFLASSAYIDNLGVRNLKTSDSGTRVEIKQTTNSLEFFSGTSTHPNVRIGSSSYSNSPSGDGAVDNHASIRVAGYDGINIISEIDFTTSGSQITSSGIRFNGVPSGQATLYEGSGSLVVKRVSAGESGGSSMRAAVVGVLDQPLRNDSTGLYFGGYFDRLLVLSNFYKYITPGSTDNLTGHIVSTSNSSETVNLPSLTVGTTDRIQRIVILKTGTGTLVVNSASGNTFENGSSSLQIIGKSKTELYWDGTSWKFFIFKSQS